VRKRECSFVVIYSRSEWSRVDECGGFNRFYFKITELNSVFFLYSVPCLTSFLHKTKKEKRALDRRTEQEGRGDISFLSLSFLQQTTSSTKKKKKKKKGEGEEEEKRGRMEAGPKRHGENERVRENKINPIEFC
jgi:hypothetical protein